MGDFERSARCERCGREFVVAGRSINPANETQRPAEFACDCGATVTAMLPGSANEELLRIVPGGGRDERNP
jgi:hypothetical protein